MLKRIYVRHKIYKNIRRSNTNGIEEDLRSCQREIIKIFITDVIIDLL